MKLVRAFLAGLACALLLRAPFAVAATPEAAISEKIAPYEARFGRTHPVIAVIGENGHSDSTTELMDFVVPYSVLARSGLAQMVTVATAPGPLTMRPALRLQPDATIGQFDLLYPDGADYVIVPAVAATADPQLLGWLLAQHNKGATLVSICDGALVLANTGLTRHHRATAHWDTQSLRREKYPDTQWIANIRYVADGKIVSSAGISAALPLSLALVEAIGGRSAASTLAQQLGVVDWSAQHDSDVFLPRFGTNLHAFVTVQYTNRWWHERQQIGLPVTDGVDELALAVSADAYSRTGRSEALSVAPSSDAIRTAHGLILLPDRISGKNGQLLVEVPSFDGVPAGRILDLTLQDIIQRYGPLTAYGVALDLEYPGYTL